MSLLAVTSTTDEWVFTYAGTTLISVEDLEQLLSQLKSTRATLDTQSPLIEDISLDIELLKKSLVGLHSAGGKINGQIIQKNRLKVAKYQNTPPQPSTAMNIASHSGWFTSFRLFFLRLFRELGLLAQFIFGRTTHIFAFVFTPIWSLVLTILGLSYIFDVVCAVREARRLSKQYEISFWQVLREDNYKLLILLLNGIVWESVNLLSVIICGIPISTELREVINHDANIGGFSSDVPNDSLSLFTQWRRQSNFNKKLSACEEEDKAGYLKAIRAEGIKNNNELYDALIKKFLVATLILVGMIIIYNAIPIAAGIVAHHLFLANTMWTSDIAIKLYGSSIAFFVGSCYAGFISRLRKIEIYQNFSTWLGGACYNLWKPGTTLEDRTPMPHPSSPSISHSLSPSRNRSTIPGSSNVRYTQTPRSPSSTQTENEFEIPPHDTGSYFNELKMIFLSPAAPMPSTPVIPPTPTAVILSFSEENLTMPLSPIRSRIPPSFSENDLGALPTSPPPSSNRKSAAYQL